MTAGTGTPSPWQPDAPAMVPGGKPGCRDNARIDGCFPVTAVALFYHVTRPADFIESKCIAVAAAGQPRQYPLSDHQVYCMPFQENIVEYLENDRFYSAYVLGDTGSRLRLINQNGKEIKLSSSRIIHRCKRALSQPSRTEILNLLQETAAERQSLMQTIDIRAIWELAKDEAAPEFSLSFLAGLCFGGNADDNHEAAFLRAIFTDRIFFKYREGNIIAQPAEKVEQLLDQLRQKQELDTYMNRCTGALQQLWETATIGDWPEQHRCLQQLRDYYLFGNDAPDSAEPRELLKRAGLTSPHAAFHLLVKAGIWDRNENIPLLRLEIPREFSKAAMEMADSLQVAEADNLISQGYRDLRHLPVLTIDGKDTRDFDDALHLEKKDGNYLVGIHIADVALYIQPGSPLFVEALERATSIYFADGPLPMLPESLSNSKLSLLAGEPRPAMSFLVLLSPDGDLLDLTVTPSIIQVKRRLSYPEADQLLKSDSELATLARLSHKLRQKRLDAGALLLAVPDVNISPGDDDRVEVSLSDVDTPSRTLIAEFMILANTVGAGFLADREAPGLFRSQPPPHQRLVHGLEKDLYQLLKQRKYLAPMSLSTAPKPHSSVGVPHYTTLTSPIRRFLDLIMQHQLRQLWFGRGDFFSKKELNEIAAKLLRNLSRANQARSLRHRYWLLKHLEARIGSQLQFLVVEKTPRRVLGVLADYLLEADLPPNQAIKTDPGERLKVNLVRASALDNTLRLSW